MNEGRDRLTDKYIAAMMATRTAIIARLCEKLIEHDVLGLTEIVNDLHEFLSGGIIVSAHGIGPLKHLLSLIDQ